MLWIYLSPSLQQSLQGATEMGRKYCQWAKFYFFREIVLKFARIQFVKRYSKH